MTLDSRAARLAPFPPTGYNPPVPSASKIVRGRVLFFGRLKEIVGRSEDFFELQDGACIAELFSHYKNAHPQLDGYQASLAASRNREFASWDVALSEGDEIAFLPPVSGG
jgi:molybdopterin synthase sulfur carrier subunit